MKRQPHAYRVEPFQVDEYMRKELTRPVIWVQAIACAAILLICFALLFVQAPA